MNLHNSPNILQILLSIPVGTSQLKSYRAATWQGASGTNLCTGLIAEPMWILIFKKPALPCAPLTNRQLMALDVISLPSQRVLAILEPWAKRQTYWPILLHLLSALRRVSLSIKLVVFHISYVFQMHCIWGDSALLSSHIQQQREVASKIWSSTSSLG